MLRLNARNPLLLVTAALIVIVVFAAMSRSLTLKTNSISSQAENQTAERVMIAPTLAFGAPAATPAPTPPPMRASFTQREIARSGSIDILAANVDTTIGRVADYARAAGGDVFGLDAQSAGDGRGSQSATITVRIPATRFDAVMARLATLGTVRSRSVRAEDLSSNITDTSARLRNLKRTEADMLKIMDRSGRVGEILDVENQLSSVREQIETLQADVASMRGRVAYSTIDIRLEAAEKSAPAEPDALTQLKNAFSAATHALADVTIAIVAAGIWLLVFTPYALVIAVTLLVVRLVLRRYWPRPNATET